MWWISKRSCSIVYNFFDNKKTSDSGIEMENMSDQQLAEELIKSITRKFKRRKVELPLIIDNIWGKH